MANYGSNVASPGDLPGTPPAHTETNSPKLGESAEDAGGTPTGRSELDNVKLQDLSPGRQSWPMQALSAALKAMSTTQSEIQTMADYHSVDNPRKRRSRRLWLGLGAIIALVLLIGLGAIFLGPPLAKYNPGPPDAGAGPAQINPGPADAAAATCGLSLRPALVRGRHSRERTRRLPLDRCPGSNSVFPRDRPPRGRRSAVGPSDKGHLEDDLHGELPGRRRIPCLGECAIVEQRAPLSYGAAHSAGRLQICKQRKRARAAPGASGSALHQHRCLSVARGKP